MSGRFKKGVSGNPAGRPKGKSRRAGLPEFDEFLNSTATVKISGQVEELPRKELIELRVFLKALKGGAREIQQVHKWLKKYLAARRSKTTPEYSAVEIKVEGPDNSNAEAALELLGILNPKGEEDAFEVSGRIPVELVNAALSRRRGKGAFDEQEVFFIEANCSSPKNIKWPKKARQ